MVNDDDTWKTRPLNELAAEYYLYFDEWLTRHFGGLKSVLQWEKFYVYLAHKVRDKAFSNRRHGEKGLRIDLDRVLVPTTPEIFNVCRLLYQALGGLRNAVPDGQHRIAGMVRLLFGYEIKTDSRAKPPRSFRYEKTHFGLLTEESEDNQGDDNLSTKMTSVLEKLSVEATVRIVVPTVTSEFEIESEGYSMVRTESQSQTKPRCLSDV